MSNLLTPNHSGLSGKQSKVQYYLQQGHKLKKSGNFLQAFLNYKQVIKIAPTHDFSYYCIGDIFQENKYFNKAIYYYNKGLQKQPRSPWLCYGMGSVLAEYGAFKDAEKFLKKSIKLDKEQAEFYEKLGDVLASLGKYHQGIALYNKAQKYSLQHEIINLKLCKTYLQLGDFPKAQSLLEKQANFNNQNTEAKLYSDFLEVVNTLAQEISEKIIQNPLQFLQLIDTPLHTNQQLSLNKILDLVKIYESLYPQSNLDIAKLSRFHHCVSNLSLPGPSYSEILTHLHQVLRPKTYVEVGIARGTSFQLVQPSTQCVGIDPQPNISGLAPVNSTIFSMTSSDFFRSHNLTQELQGNFVDLAFIDGLHWFDQALQDFIEIEKHSHQNGLILFHDTLPLDEITARRDRTTQFWSGDVWKVVPILKTYRPDLKIFTIATKPTGLTCVTNLNPTSKTLIKFYSEIIEEYFSRPYPQNSELRSAMLSVIPNNWKIILDQLELPKRKSHSKMQI